jgi:Bacterial Ig domain
VVTHGVLDLRSSGRFTYQPDPGYLGTDTFRYRPSGALLAVTAQIQVTNAAPVTRNDSYTWAGGKLSVSAPGVLTNDTDADGDALSAELVGGGVSGSLNMNPNGGFTLNPGGGFGSSGSFQYRVWDGRVWSAPATVTLTIAAATPTPAPTPPPTPRPTPTPRPLPSLPLPSIPPPSLPLPSIPLPSVPLPSVPGLLPTPRPSPAPTDPAAQPTSPPAPGSTSRPAASASPDPATPLPAVIPPIGPPGGGDDPDAQPQPGLRLPSRNGIDLGLGLGDLGIIGGFSTWVVPAATVGGAGLLVLLFVALQGGATVVWVPAVRRLRGERRPRRRRR